MSARASGVSICPSGVRRKMASGAGQAPRSWMTLVWSLLLAATSASATLVRSMAEREPAEARSSSSRMWARMRARNSLSSYVSSTPSWSSARREMRPSTSEAAEAVAVERREEQVAHADVELERLDVGVALGRLRHRVVRQQRAHQAVPEVGERQPLDVGVALVLAGGGDDEVDERVVGVAPVDRERRDPGAGDHREGEERLTDDVAQGLEAPDAIADAFEPPVGAHRVEREDAFPGHIVQRRSVARDAAPCHLAR